MIRNFSLALFLSVLIAFVEPWLTASLYAARLSRLAPPSGLPVPVERIRPEALRDSWHATRPGGRRHEGIDIFAPRGTPVRASTEGVVLHVGSSARGGLVVWILGPGGQRHYYAHLERFADVHRGQRVEAGTRLGYVGTSGNARGTTPHLHYGIYGRAGALNPFPLLRAGRREVPGRAMDVALPMRVVPGTSEEILGKR